MSKYVGAGGTVPLKETETQSAGRAAGCNNRRRGPVGAAPGNTTSGGGINRALRPTKQK
jgi:hypothetical protein